MAACAQHGQYIAGGGCPVCQGKPRGGCWSTATAAAARLRQLFLNPDDPWEAAVWPYAPEMDRAWRGQL